jgi:hypothetical protein
MSNLIFSVEGKRWSGIDSRNDGHRSIELKGLFIIRFMRAEEDDPTDVKTAGANALQSQ